MIYSYITFGLSALLPAAVSYILYILEKKFSKNKLNYAVKQGIYGTLFGILAIIGTEAGIPLHGAQVNCRDAAVLCAGLLFGAPAGIIAGLIGGIERWIAVAWGVGSFTRVACTLSTILAGFYSAALRKHLFENKKPGIIIAFTIGVVIEAFHMIMVFITNMDQPQQAMAVVQVCTKPMMLVNGLSVMLAVFLMEHFGHSVKHKEFSQRKRSRISQIIQRWLLAAVLLAFALTSLFVIRLQDTVASIQADRSLKNANEEVMKDIQDAADAYLVSLTKEVAGRVDSMDLKSLAEEYLLSEINIVDHNGIITKSTQKQYVGFDMASGEQSAEFLCLLGDQEVFVQKLMPITYNSNIMRKYFGMKLGDGFIQLGYDTHAVQLDLAMRVQDFTKNKGIGETGFVLIIDSVGNLVSTPADFPEEFKGELVSMELPPEGIRSTILLGGEEYFCRRDNKEGYSILAMQTVTEAMHMRTLSIYVNTFLEILVFALLFGLIYLLIRKVVVNQIKSINGSLAKISGGNLDEVVNVRSNEEFSSLSDDINSTVNTLKKYIADASARIDRELEAAKTIQASALPLVHPNFTGRNDLDIHAFMATAKEVGGDFYDFYMTDSHTFNFLIADVSGKGIPAAMFMMRAKTELKNVTESGADVQEVFFSGNRDLCQGNDAEMFVTAWQGCLDLNTGEIRYVNAGHNQPLVRHSDGKFEMLKSKVNFVLGGMDGVRYVTQQLKLERGDTLFLYTDGVTEATNQNRELYGNDRLLQIANAREYETMADFCAAVKADIDLFVGDAPQFDDISMLGIRYIGQKPDWHMEFSEAVLDDIPSLTECAEAELEKMGCSMRVITQISVAIDEIYSNIVKFAYPQRRGPTSVIIHEEQSPHTVSVIFEDQGIPYNPLTNAEPDITLSAEERKIGGLGIFIVKKTMDDVQYRYENDRNIFTIVKKLE